MVQEFLNAICSILFTTMTDQSPSLSYFLLNESLFKIIITDNYLWYMSWNFQLDAIISKTECRVRELLSDQCEYFNQIKDDLIKKSERTNIEMKCIKCDLANFNKVRNQCFNSWKLVFSYICTTAKHTDFDIFLLYVGQ